MASYFRYLTLKTTKLWQRGLRLFRAMTLQPNLAHQPKTNPISDAEFSYIFSSSNDRTEKGLRVCIHNMQSSRKSSREDAAPIVDDSAVVLENSGRFLHVGGGTVAAGDEPVPPTPDADSGESADAAEQGVTNESGFNVGLALVKKQGAVPMMIHRVNISQVSDVMVGVAAVPPMRHTIDMLVASTKKLSQPGKEFEATSRKVRNAFREFGAVPQDGRPGGIVQKLTNFVCTNDSLDHDFDYSDLEAKVSKLSRAGSDPRLAASHARRQALMREQGIIMMLLEALEVVMKSCEKIAALHADHADDEGSVKSGKSSRSVKRSKRDGPVEFWLKLRDELSTPLFWLLYVSLHQAPANQLHAADQLTTMIAYVPHNIVSTKCIVHMLSTNMDVQESKVGTDDVAKFIAMIREAPMEWSYLKLLMSVCSCGGAGVDGNQCNVADMWLDGATDYHIGIRPAAKSQPHKIEWCRALPEKKKLHAYIKGYNLIEDGIPELALYWVTTRDDLSVSAVSKLCNQMDGKLSISSLAVGQRDRSQAVAGTPGGSSSGSFRMTTDPAAEAARTITDYLVAQLYLAAEICLDRNYVAIAKVSESMPYETCIAVLHDKDVPNRVKAAVIRLINTVYLDADPMIEKRVPRLSHPWSVINEAPVALPCIREEYQHSFYLVQVSARDTARETTREAARASRGLHLMSWFGSPARRIWSRASSRRCSTRAGTSSRAR